MQLFKVVSSDKVNEEEIENQKNGHPVCLDNLDIVDVASLNFETMSTLLHLANHSDKIITIRFRLGPFRIHYQNLLFSESGNMISDPLNYNISPMKVGTEPA